MIGIKLRFINFLIDSIAFFVLLVIFLWVFKKVIDRDNAKWVSLVCYFLYYFMFEYFLGQTIGKIVTKSRVISLTNKRNYFFIQIFSRTLMRFIIFDLFSFLFTYRGLHDWISKTELIKLK
jgi:uncharacterized RDD family membrane protein YckC